MTDNPNTSANEQEKRPGFNLDWAAQSYLLWTAAGTLLGTMAGFLYNRAASEYAERNGGKPPRPGTLELMGLIVAAIAMVRQIIELGRPDEES